MSATAIAQTYLDAVSGIVMANDWQAYVDHMSWPFLMVTHDRTMTFDAPEDICAIFTGFRDLLKSQRVTDYIRLVESAEQIDQDLITARYVTHLMSGSVRIIEPVRSVITLRHEDARWRAASIINALSNSRWPLLLPRRGEDLL